MMKRSYVLAAGLALAATAWIGSGLIGGDVSPKEPAKRTPQAVTPAVRVSISRARPMRREIVLFGRTEAIRHAELRAETAGRLVERPVAKGSWVEKGAVIARLALDDRDAKLAEAKAQLERRRIAYEAARRLSKKQFRGAVQVSEQKAYYEEAKAQLAAIRVDIGRTRLRAPFAGFVDTLPPSVGDFIEVGDKVASVIALDPLRIVGKVSERDVGRIPLGAKAKVRLPTGDELEGTVRYISRAGSESTRTFRVDVWVANPDFRIRQGLTAELRLPGGEEQAHMVSPALLTLSGEGTIGVKTVDEDGTVRFRRVEIIADTADGVWLGGLPETVTIITVGQDFVRAGQKVRPVFQSQGDAPEPEPERKRRRGRSAPQASNAPAVRPS